MPIWQKAKVTGTDTGSRVQVDAAGSSWIRFLSESFRSNDGVDFGTIRRGIQLIFGGVESVSGGGTTRLLLHNGTDYMLLHNGTDHLTLHSGIVGGINYTGTYLSQGIY